MSTKLLGISGSLRKSSYNTALLRAFAERMPEGVTLELADIGDLIPYNEDVQNKGMPEAVVALKENIRAADGVLIATPEYNRSISGVLKNAIDWASRPHGDSAWEGKRIFVMGASTGGLSTAIAQSHLKHTMLYLNALPMGQPEFYCGNVGEKFDTAGNLTDEKTGEYITKGISAFLAFIGKQ